MSDYISNVDEIFCAAIELSTPEERGEYVDRACGGNAELRHRVDALLAAHFGAGDFLEQSPATALLPDHENIQEAPGTLIGPYKLLEQIGEGGMGVVYMADQQAPVRRRVALKVIKTGMDTRQVIARFEAERQALALMDHSNIARVLDAGATESGRPYFVMELVRGIPITEYCDQNNLPVHERLELFVQVCSAVQHAHQKGIIHRDLKPSNVLVTLNDGRAVPKVIDFGVAKATGQQLTEKTLFTAFAQIVGTPLYMSPEQAEMTSVDIDTRSDIYSLGVLLYELLTGTTPFDQDRMRSAAFDEMRRIIREEEPPKPSTRISTLGESRTATAAHRQVDSRGLSQLVEGDLDWIVMKALEKDRTRRYDTAGNFAADVLRHLSDEPVAACPPTAAYRFRKFARRNRVVLITVTLVAGALVLGTVISTWQAIRATQAADLTELARATEAEQRAEAERQRQQAEVNEKKAKTEAAKSQQVAQFLTEMLESAGPGVARGRDATLLREILDKTAERVEKDLKKQPEVQGDLWFTLGNTYYDVGNMRRSITMYQRSVDSYRLAFGDENAKLAQALGHLGRRQSRIGDVATGNANAQLGLQMARKCGDRGVLAACLFDLGTSFDHSSLVSTEGIAFLRESVALRRQLGNDPVVLAESLSALAEALRESETVEAESLAREALSLHRQHLGAEHPYVIEDLGRLGDILLMRGRLPEATDVLRQTVDLSRRVLDKDDQKQYLTLYLLANTLGRQQKWGEAEAAGRQAVEACPSVAGYWGLLGSVNACRHDWPAAAEQFSHGVELKPDYLVVVGRLAITLLKMQRSDEFLRLRHKYLNQDTISRDVIGSEHTLRLVSTFLLLPADGEDLERLSRLGDLAAKPGDIKRNEYWKEVINAQTEYRRGNFSAASKVAERVVARPGTWMPGKALAWYVRAMACAQLDQTEAARTALAHGDKLVAASDWRHTDLWGWTDWAIAELLHGEAAELIGDAAPANGDQLRTNAIFRERGNRHAAAERWNEAVADFSRAVELDPNDEQASFSLAVALLKNAKEAEYRRHCHTHLERIAESRSFSSADKAAKAALLLPVEGADFERACTHADFAATATEPSHLLPWVHMGKALAEYRRARFDSANEWAKRCVSADKVFPECEATAWFIEAAAHARLEQVEAARAAFAKGEELEKQPRSNVDLSWLDWAIADILRREAADLLGIAKPEKSTDAATQP